MLVLAILVLTVPAHAQATRLFVDDAGHEVEIPIDPQRIVSMRGEQFTAPLIELGANLVGSSGRSDPLRDGGAPYVRGAYDALDFRFETSDVTWIGDPNAHDFEAVAAVEPDLILLPDFAADSYDKLSLIAPTVVINIWDRPFLDRYRVVADLAGRLPQFEAGLALYEERLARAKQTLIDAIGDPSAVSVVIAQANKEAIRAFKDYDALSQVLHDLGFSMPAVVTKAEGARIDLSFELIHQIDADFMIDTYWAATGSGVAQQLANWDRAVPSWREILHAPRHNQFFMVNREEMRAVSFQALRTVLDIVVSQIATRGFVPLGGEQGDLK
jgi:iron complex transport system substrate-binding protein